MLARLFFQPTCFLRGLEANKMFSLKPKHISVGEWQAFSRKDKAFNLYIHHRNYLTKGYTEIQQWTRWASMFVQWFLLPSMILGWGAIKRIPNIGGVILGIGLVFLLFLFFLCWFLGWFWDVRKLYQVENEWNNRRNPFPEEMRQWRKQEGEEK